MAKTSRKAANTRPLTLEDVGMRTPRTLEDHCGDAIEMLQETLVLRGASYGSFFDNSEVAVSIQELLQTTGADFRNAIHDKVVDQSGNSSVPISLVYLLINAQNMIAAKLSRITQTPLHKDSWLDLAGYAILAHAAISMKSKP